MFKRIQKKDIFFGIIMLLGLIIILHNLFAYPITDETFYPSTALRLINGDSLIQSEWHMTQFSSLFNFLPVLLFQRINGSTDGIILYLRLIYLLIHCFVAIFTYRCFRSKGIVAAFAVSVFFIPFYMFTISYHTVYVISWLLLTICLYLAFIQQRKYLYVCVGFIYGICCICNPLLCCLFPLYVLLFFIYKKRISTISYKTESDGMVKPLKNEFKIAEIYFNENTIRFIFFGLFIIAAISVLFFFFTGGKISSLVDNLKMMFSVSEYSDSLLLRIKNIFFTYSSLSFNLPFVLPLLFVFLLFDKRRKEVLHRFIYLFCAFVLFCLYVIRILTSYELGTFSVLLPVAMFSNVCYILTSNKNKTVFYCMWLPGVIGASLHLISSRATFMAFGGSILPSAFSGIFLISELFYELRTEIIFFDAKVKKNQEFKSDNRKKTKALNAISVLVIVFFICIQSIFQMYSGYSFYDWYGVPEMDYSKCVYVTNGPMKGTFMLPDYYEEYQQIKGDLDYIKEHSEPSEPVLILSEYPWPYLYIDRPWASYSAWNEIVNFQALGNYYAFNPEKSPKYIYITKNSYNIKKELALKNMFSCKKTFLSEGILLTVKDRLDIDIKTSGIREEN